MGPTQKGLVYRHIKRLDQSHHPNSFIFSLEKSGRFKAGSELAGLKELQITDEGRRMFEYNIFIYYKNDSLKYFVLFFTINILKSRYIYFRNKSLVC